MRHYLSSQIEKLKLLLTERQSQLMSHRTTLLSDYTTDTANLATNSIVAVDTMVILYVDVSLWDKYDNSISK